MMDKNVEILPEIIIIYADDMNKLFRNSTSMNDLSNNVQTPITRMAIPPTYIKHNHKVVIISIWNIFISRKSIRYSFVVYWFVTLPEPGC